MARVSCSPRRSGRWWARTGCGSLGRAQDVASYPNGYLPGVTAKGLFGWNAFGELGVDQTADVTTGAYQLGEYGYGGIAETFWSIDPARELVLLWFTQQVDNFSWTTPRANLWTAARRAVGTGSGRRDPPGGST